MACGLRSDMRVRRYCRGRQWPKRAALRLHAPALTLLLIMLNAGLFMVDHIHFQYNGMLMGVLILGITALDRGMPYWAAFAFSVLVNAKHLFLAVCPAVFVYILRRHCRSREHPSGLLPLARAAH